MADKPIRNPAPRKGTGAMRVPPGSERDTTEMSRMDVAAHFGDDMGPVPAHPEDLVETEAATRVATGAQIYEVAQASGGSVHPTLLDSGWRQEDAAMPHDVHGVYPTIPSDASEDSTRVLPSMDDPRWGVSAQQSPYYDPMMGQAEPVYVVDAQVVDNSAMPVAQGYEMVVGGAMPQAGPDQGGYSWLRINPPEHVGQVSQDLVMMTHPDGFAAGQFRTLRYRLEQETNTQILVVTSPRDGEGKSVTAANLALALAEGGRIQVLLIDAALRNPSQHKLFGIRGELGLTSVLAMRQDDPSLPIDVIGITRSLCLIPAGPPVASPHAALASEAAAVLIGQVRREFRYIIVDSSSVFGAAETLAWHGLIDKYILLARGGKTTTEDLSAASERLNRDRILGVTFVGAKGKRK